MPNPNVREKALSLLADIEEAHSKRNDSPHYHIGALHELIAHLAVKEEMFHSNSILNELADTLDWVENAA